MYDLIIIGAGTAGISAYKEAIKYTQNILIINQGPWDTTCARVGCMPSKVLISVANRVHDIQTADKVALNVKSIIDTSQVMPHVRQLRDKFTNSTLDEVNQWNSSHKISGLAKFINPTTIEVNQQQYQAKAFILAVGSTPKIDENLKKELQDRLITSDQIFELEKLPKSIAVIGSGIIALELAQAMNRLGVTTTIFARSLKVGSLTSPTLQKIAQKEFKKELNIKFEILPKSVHKIKNKIQIKYIEKNKEKILKVDYLLSATGRTSNLNTLNLNKINEKYQKIEDLPIHSETKQLDQYPIFIIGDAFTKTPLQHEAAIEGKLAVHNCLNLQKIKNIKILTPLAIVFSSPEMANVGRTYAELEKNNIDYITGFNSFENQGRAVVLGKNQGAIEVYVDKKSHKLLGAELFMASAEHIAHLLCWAISEELTIEEILIKPFYHPTLEEGLRTALKHARRQL